MTDRRTDLWKALPFPVVAYFPTTRGTSSRPIFRAPGVNCIVTRITLLPVTDFAANASDYWTLSLVTYDEAGTLQSGMPFDEKTSSFSTDMISLVIGRPIVLPTLGHMHERLLADWTLALKATETGAAAALELQVQADILIGG